MRTARPHAAAGLASPAGQPGLLITFFCAGRRGGAQRGGAATAVLSLRKEALAPACVPRCPFCALGRFFKDLGAGCQQDWRAVGRARGRGKGVASRAGGLAGRRPGQAQARPQLRAPPTPPWLTSWPWSLLSPLPAMSCPPPPPQGTPPDPSSSLHPSSLPPGASHPSLSSSLCSVSTTHNTPCTSPR